MAKRRPKDIGTEFTTGVIRYLNDHGYPFAELRNQHGTNDQGDITGLGPGLVIECKGGHAAEAASDAQIAAWLRETEVERQNARADVGVLVTKRKGYGRANAGLWWAHMDADTFYVLMGQSSPSEDAVIGTTLHNFPVRLHLRDAVTLLRSAGYGDPISAEYPDED
jgi:transposase